MLLQNVTNQLRQYTMSRTALAFYTRQMGKVKRQCTCNVTLRQVHESLLQWKSNKYYIFVCLCVFFKACECVWVGYRTPACACTRVAFSSIQRACALLSAASLFHHIFRLYLTKARFSKKKSY